MQSTPTACNQRPPHAINAHPTQSTPTPRNQRHPSDTTSAGRGEVNVDKRQAGYAGSPIHRIVKGFVVQGGDVIAGNGSGCVSAVGNGGPFADESFAVPHSRSVTACNRVLTTCDRV